MALLGLIGASFGTLLLLAILLVLVLAIKWVASAVYENFMYNLPPGPQGIPILGCLPKVDVDTPLHYVLSEMSEKYGDIFSLRLGDKLTTVISSLEAMKASISLQGRKFAGRPYFNTFKETKGGFDKGLSLRDVCDDYKQHRKLVHHGFKNLFSTCGQIQSILPDECQKLVDYLGKMGSESFDPRVIFRKAAASSFLRVTFGDNYDYDEPELVRFIRIMEEWFEIAESNNPADFMPYLEFLPNERLKKAKRITDNFDEFCKEKLLKGWRGEVESNGYFLSSFVEEMKRISKRLVELGQEDQEEKVIDAVASRYASVVTDMIGGGFDTVPNTLSWMMLYLSENEEALSCLQDELKSLNKENFTDLLSTEKSPQLTASVYEAIRHSTVAPLALPHSTTEEVKVFDYVLPKDSLVFVNLWAINHSEDLWEEPEKFDPSRFLINNNEFDLMKTRSVYAFSTGVRRCPGEKFAIKELQAFVGTMLQHFDFKISKAPKDMDAVKGLTSKPKHYEIVLSRKS